MNKEINKLSVCNLASMGVTIPSLKYAVVQQINSSEELAIQKLLRTMNFDNYADAVIDIIVVKDTVDNNWVVDKALKGFNPDKITYLNYKEI